MVAGQRESLWDFQFPTTIKETKADERQGEREGVRGWGPRHSRGVQKDSEARQQPVEQFNVKSQSAKSLGALESHVAQPLAAGDSCCVTVEWEAVFC